MSQTSPPVRSARESFQSGLEHQQAGRMHEAEAAYRRALELVPEHAEAHNNLGNVLFSLGRAGEAVLAYQRSAELLPQTAVVHNNLGKALAAVGRHGEAERCIRRAIACQPHFAEAHNDLGKILQQKDAYAEAERSYRLACALSPRLAEAHLNLASLLFASKRIEEAESEYRQALDLEPNRAQIHDLLGIVLRDQGRLGEAESSFRRALAIKPDFDDVHNNLGMTLHMLGRNADAELHFRAAIRLRPEFAQAHSNLGTLLGTCGRLEEAAPHLRQAIALLPRFAEAHANLGVLLQNLGRHEEAVDSYRKAMDLKAEYSGAASNLLFLLNYISEEPPARIFAQHQEFARRFCSSSPSIRHANLPDQNRRLRIGYVSGDLRDHPVSFFLEPVLAGHDKSRFEITCYYNFPHPDAVTHRLKGLTDRWRNAHALSDDALSEQIRADGIDILVDLSGHTGENRLRVFGRKPAPVQATWLGYLNTTGLEAMDYRITDAHATPEGPLDGFHSEKLVRLPDCQWCYRPHVESPPVVRPPCLSSTAITFAAFANPAKFGKGMLRLWSRLLVRVPGSRLLLAGATLNSMPPEFLEPFVRQGISAERVQLLGSRPFAAYLHLHSEADIMLDTYPYSGGTTTCHALWMGVPVVTLAGESATSRGGASLLHAVGLDDLVADNAEQHLDIAALLAADPQRLAALRSTMRARMKGSPLMDEARFTRNLESAYREMWRAWCDKRVA